MLGVSARSCFLEMLLVWIDLQFPTCDHDIKLNLEVVLAMEEVQAVGGVITLCNFKTVWGIPHQLYCDEVTLSQHPSQSRTHRD